MPYTEQQRRLFNAAAHDKDIAERHGMSHGEAEDLADEANRLKKEGKEKPEKKASFVDLCAVFGIAPQPSSVAKGDPPLPLTRSVPRPGVVHPSPVSRHPPA